MNNDSYNLDKNGGAYELYGDPAAPVVALIHGLGLNRRMWDAHIPALKKNYRVLVYDLFGHGDSIAPITPLSLSVFARQLKNLLDETNINKCAIVGFSLGGMICRRFAMDFPQRTLALAIFNSPHERSHEMQQLAEERAARTVSCGIAATIDETLTRWFTETYRHTQRDNIANIRRQLLANNINVYAQSRQVLANGVLELIRPQPPITRPTLIITCENDSGSAPSMAHAIAAEIAHSQTLIIPHLRHMGLIEEPQKFTQPLLKFLAAAMPPVAAD